MTSAVYRSLFFSTVMLASLSASAQDTVKADPVLAGPQPAIGTKRAIIVCGLGGDQEHHKLFADTVIKLHEGLCKQLGFVAENVQILFGDEPQDSDTETIKSARRATRVELEKGVAELREQVRPEDTVWVIILGHCHHDGRSAWLNLPGPDIHHGDFAKLFNGLTAAQQVFFITTPLSGLFIKPLSAKGRVVITSTLADLESNETEYPHALAKVLTSPPDEADFDIDHDGAITVFDLYITVARNVAQSYVEQELLATEHPLLDDNGDGDGTEVQIDYLTEEQGGRARLRKRSAPPTITSGDGKLSKSIPLTFTRPEPPKPTTSNSPDEVK